MELRLVALPATWLRGFHGWPQASGNYVTGLAALTIPQTITQGARRPPDHHGDDHRHPRGWRVDPGPSGRGADRRPEPPRFRT